MCAVLFAPLEIQEHIILLGFLNPKVRPFKHPWGGLDHICFELVTALRMGKKEGLANQQKRRCHDAWMADKTDQRHNVFTLLMSVWTWVKYVTVLVIFASPNTLLRLAWFLHENVPEYPEAFLEPLLERYNVQKTLISPQRFGKPMNRCNPCKKDRTRVFEQICPSECVPTSSTGCVHTGSSMTRTALPGRDHRCGRFWNCFVLQEILWWMQMICFGCPSRSWTLLWPFKSTLLGCALVDFFHFQCQPST